MSVALPIQCSEREKVGGEGCDLGNLILPIVSGLLVPGPWAHFALGALSWALWPAQAPTRKKKARRKAQKHRDMPSERKKCVSNLHHCALTDGHQHPWSSGYDVSLTR